MGQSGVGIDGKNAKVLSFTGRNEEADWIAVVFQEQPRVSVELFETSAINAPRWRLMTDITDVNHFLC